MKRVEINKNIELLTLNKKAKMCSSHKHLAVILSVLHVAFGGILFGQTRNRDVAQSMWLNQAFDGDDWEPVYRIYQGQGWDSHDDYISKERSARFGDKDDSQFRSWRLDQWNHNKIHKVRIELYDDGDEVAEFEFEGTMANLTSFFTPQNLRRTTYDDIPDGLSGRPFSGDLFSFDGDDDARHWTVSSRHIGDCRNDEGWIQVLDKPKPGRDRCVCGYENVDEYPTIMYAKGNRKARWSDRHNVGHADMMQVSISAVPYPPQPTRPPVRAPAPPPMRQPEPQPPMSRQQTYLYPFETKK